MAVSALFGDRCGTQGPGTAPLSSLCFSLVQTVVVSASQGEVEEQGELQQGPGVGWAALGQFWQVARASGSF